MDAIRNSGVTELKRRSTMKLEEGCGTTVRVVSGNVWLTQYKDTADYLMRAGDSVVLNGKGTTLIYAFEESSLRFAAPVNSRLPCGIELRLRSQVAVPA